MIIPHSDVPQQFFEILKSRINDKEGNAYLHSKINTYYFVIENVPIRLRNLACSLLQ